MLIADDDVRDHANREKALKLGQQWREAGYHVISMRDDFKTIYGEGVTKTDFSFPIDTKPLTEWQAGRTVSQEAVEAFGGIAGDITYKYRLLLPKVFVTPQRLNSIHIKDKVAGCSERFHIVAGRLSGNIRMAAERVTTVAIPVDGLKACALLP